MNMLRKALFVSAFGYVSYFFSERVFWSFFRPLPEDTFDAFLLTWFVYSMLGYLALGLIWRYRVTDWKRLFLVGAIYGWVGEGAVVTTMYGTTMGMWATISFTGLAWHALLTGLFGWLFLSLGVRGGISLKKYIVMLITIGLFWGLWALNWGFEGAGWDVSIDAFIKHTWIYALPLPFAYFLLSKLSRVSMELSRTEWCVHWALFGALYVYWNVTAGIFPFSLLLPALLWLTLRALKRSRIESDEPVYEALWGNGSYSLWRGLSLLLIPLVATAAYSVAFELFGALHTNWLAFFVTMPAGYALFVYSIWRCFYPKRIISLPV